MAASRIPGPLGIHRSASIDASTLCRITSATTGPVGNVCHKSSRIPSSPLIIFFGGACDADSLLFKLLTFWDKDGHNNMKTVYNNYSHGNHRACFYTWDSGDEAVQRILLEAKTDPEVRVCLVGHSFGGDTAIDVAEEVNEKGDGFEIELVVTLDAVSPGAHFEWQKDKPENVFYWFNVHVQWELDWNNIVAQTGGHWGKQENADSNIQMPKGVFHHQASQMFDTVKGAVWNFHLLEAL